jgi:isopentenyldiphosphate isomerase
MGAQNERVDVLTPPLFIPSGVVKTREQAYNDGDWVGGFNLWVFTKDPVPSIIYQQRSRQKQWAPGLLDVAAGGHFLAGEKLLDGLREVKEELGKDYAREALHYLGRSLFVIVDVNGRNLNEIVELYMIEDDNPLQSYVLQKEEVAAIFSCPIQEVLRVNREPGYEFTAHGLNNDGAATKLVVNKESFPENWNNYHYKMAVLADRYFKGETELLF